MSYRITHHKFHTSDIYNTQWANWPICVINNLAKAHTSYTFDKLIPTSNLDKIDHNQTVQSLFLDYWTTQLIISQKWQSKQCHWKQVNVYMELEPTVHYRWGMHNTFISLWWHTHMNIFYIQLYNLRVNIFTNITIYWPIPKQE